MSLSPADEGFTDDLDAQTPDLSVVDCEELAYRLLLSLPRSRLATIQRRIAPLLQFDVVGALPIEISLQIFSHLSAVSLLKSATVSKRWRVLADDPFLWKQLCLDKGWEWRTPVRTPTATEYSHFVSSFEDSDDEGMGDEELHVDSGFASMSMPLEDQDAEEVQVLKEQAPSRASTVTRTKSAKDRHSAPSILPSLSPSPFSKPDYKLLHRTHTRLRARIISSSYRVTTLQHHLPNTPTGNANAHTNTIYCLQLYTDPESGVQSLFTGSRDRTIREWNLTTGVVERVISGIHESSVLSICVYGGYLASAGSDRQVVVWDLRTDQLVKVIQDHDDSVLCVRFDGTRLVSCSKDRTVRTYRFPELLPEFVFGAHRAAVNAVALSDDLIISASGDRSVRLWATDSGKLIHTFENHHSRGIAAIDFDPPHVLSGSSDKHLRFFDISTLQGWSTSPDYDHATQPVCHACGSATTTGEGRVGPPEQVVHTDLVRSVAFGHGEEFVISGSYDLSIKVWDRNTGALVANLAGGHTGRIFCVGFDCTKIVSCGEDQKICIWDFSHGIETNFLKL